MNRKWNKFLTEGERKEVGIVVCLNDKQQFLRKNALENISIQTDERAQKTFLPPDNPNQSWFQVAENEAEAI